MVDRPTTKNLKKVPKPPEFVDTAPDDTDNEKGASPKQPQEPPKLPRFVDMDSDDTDDEQE